jgi:hypothetical protein
VSINSLIVTALSGVVPVAFGSWKGATIPDQYCTFNTMSMPESSADDAMDYIRHYIYLDLWSSSSYIAMLASIHTAMDAAGFLWQEERAIDEPDTQTNHVAMTWTYLEEV